MSYVTAYLKRAPRTLLFWLIIAVFGAAAIRSAFPNEPFDEVRTGDQPLEVAGTDDGVWVLNYGDHSVSLINPTSKEEVFETVVGADVAPALSANADGAWLILEGGDTIGRIDADAEEIADRFDITGAIDDGSVAQDLAAGDGFVWVTTGEAGEMVRLDTETGEFDEPIDLGQSVVQPQIVGDSLWVYQSDGITEYDSTTGEELRQLDTAASRVHDFFATEDSVYVIVNTDNVEEEGFLVRMDPDNAEQSSESAPRVRLQESTPTHLAAIDEQVFVSGTAGILQEVESLANETHLTLIASEQVTVSTKDLRTVIVLDDTIWIADGTNGVVHQPISGIEGEITTEDTIP
jgi:streptogramin lyase